MDSNRRRQARALRGQRTLGATVKTVHAQLTNPGHEIYTTVRGSPVWRAADDLLTSVPGIGDITPRTLITELPELGRLDCRRIAALATRSLGPALAEACSVCTAGQRGEALACSLAKPGPRPDAVQATVAKFGNGSKCGGARSLGWGGG